MVLHTAKVSTHSRLKAAGLNRYHHNRLIHVSTHSRLKAAGKYGVRITEADIVSTHSRLKAAGLAAKSQSG